MLYPRFRTLYPFVIKAFSRITKSNFLLGEVRWIDEGSSDVPDDEGEHGGPVDAERDPLVVPLPIVNLNFFNASLLCNSNFLLCFTFLFSRRMVPTRTPARPPNA